MDNSLGEKLLFSLLFGGIGVFFFFFFRRRNYFNITTQPIRNLPGFYPLFAFIIYFLSLFLMHKIASITEQKSAIHPIQIISIMEFSRLMILALIFAWIFVRSPKEYAHLIWKRTPLAPAKDIIHLFAYFIVVFPLSLCTYQLLELFVYLIFKVMTIPSQLVVQFILLSIPYPLSLTLLSITIVILAPFVEETLFRGFFLTWLRGKMGAKGAILTSAIAFTLFHFMPGQGLGNIPILGSLFILACFLGVIYERRGSLLAPILLHSLFNAVSLIQILLLKESAL